MPRQKKENAQPMGEETVSRKARKAYPDRETRISMADSAIERLGKLNASRRELIEKTEAKLNERKAALAKTEEAYRRAVSRKERLEAAGGEEAKQALRERKAAEKANLEKLKAAIEASGKSIEDFIAEMK